jgi:hypothetical protein
MTKMLVNKIVVFVTFALGIFVAGVTRNRNLLPFVTFVGQRAAVMLARPSNSTTRWHSPFPFRDFRLFFLDYTDNYFPFDATETTMKNLSK